MLRVLPANHDRRWTTYLCCRRRELPHQLLHVQEVQGANQRRRPVGREWSNCLWCMCFSKYNQTSCSAQFWNLTGTNSARSWLSCSSHDLHLLWRPLKRKSNWLLRFCLWTQWKDYRVRILTKNFFCASSQPPPSPKCSLLKYFVSQEVGACESSGVIFRGTSFASKLVSAYIVKRGGEFLREALGKPFEILSKTGIFEINPTLVDTKRLDKNQKTLYKMTSMVLNSICDAILYFPLFVFSNFTFCKFHIWRISTANLWRSVRASTFRSYPSSMGVDILQSVDSFSWDTFALQFSARIFTV